MGLGILLKVSVIPANFPYPSILIEEIKVGFDILKSLRIRSRGINFIARPSCSPQRFDVISTVNELERRLEDVTTAMDYRMRSAA